MTTLHKSPVLHLAAKVRLQEQKRGHAALGLIAGFGLTICACSYVTLLLLPAGAVIGWSVKALLDANQIDTLFRG